MNKWLSIVLLVVQFSVQAQVNRYVVYFADKANSDYSVNRPLEFLSERAIFRREKQNIDITTADFPVNKNYLDSLRKYNARPFFSSRWLNAALVESEVAVLELLVLEDYIASFEYVAPDTKLVDHPDPVNIEHTANQPARIQANSANQLAMIGADKMHLDGYTGDGVLIAMLDAGFKEINNSTLFQHVFENNRLIDVKNFVTNENDVFLLDDHGTSAFSCIASKSEALTGTAYNATFALYLTEDKFDEYRVEEYNWLFGAERADSLGADIISSSVGYNEFQDPVMDYTYQEADGLTAIVSKAAKMASQRGILVVNSAGNEGRNVNSWPYILMPSDVDEVLVVGAVGQDRIRAVFSSVGPASDGTIKPDVTALGIQVATFNDSNSISSLSGTSFSTPLVAGLAAGLWEKFPELNRAELKELILSSSSNKFSPDSLVGYGIPNYSFAGSEGVLSVQLVMEDVVSVFPNPFNSDHVSIRIEREYAYQMIHFTLYAPDGKVVNTKSVKKYRKGDVLTMDINDTSKGVYLLNVKIDGITKNVKLLRY